MAIVGIPEAIHDFNMYLTGNKLGGITGEVEMPPFESMTSTVSGAGILGEYEAPTPGHFGSMEQEIPFRCINRDYFNMVDPTQPLELTLRGAIQYAAASTQATECMGMRVVFRGKPKNVNIGTVRQRGSMDSTITLELTYVLVEMDGKSMIEIDKINPTYKVNGNDVLSKIKQLT